MSDQTPAAHSALQNEAETFAPVSPWAPGPAAAVVAPPWHTVLLIVVLLGVSLLNSRMQPHLSYHAAVSSHGTRLLTYSVTLVWEWLLLAFIGWGLRMRRIPWRQLLGASRPDAMEWWTDIAIASGFWFASATTLAACAALLRRVHIDPATMRAAVLRMAPASATELMLWIALSITAGICEELIFRGYLQQQLIALTRRVWAGAALSAILFGLAHGYQGLSGVLLITIYGAFFSVLALRRRSLRAGMFAHAWQDASSGVILFLLAHVLHRLPH